MHDALTDAFAEILRDHTLVEATDDLDRCSCGLRFPEPHRLPAHTRYVRHLCDVVSNELYTRLVAVGVD